MEKKCKTCKKKKLSELDNFETPQKTQPLVYVLIILYTLLAGYGLVSIIRDITTFINNIF